MSSSSLAIDILDAKLLLKFSGELSLYTISSIEKQLENLNTSVVQSVEIDLSDVSSMDTAASIFINNLQTKYISENIKTDITNVKGPV